MKLSKKLAFGSLVLCFTLQFGGCSSISNLLGISGESETAKNDKGQLEQQQNDKQKQINDLRADLELNQQKAKDERKRCDDMTKDTVKAGKNPENQKDSPQTYAQCQKALLIEGQVKTTEEKQLKAEAELIGIDKKISSMPTVESKSDDGFNWLSFLLFGFAGLAGLVAIASLHYVLSNKIEERIGNERSSRHRDIDSVRSEQSQIRKLDKKVKDQGVQLTDIQSAIQSLQRQIAELRGQNNQQQAVFTQPVFKPEPQFPVAAEDYLNKVRSNAQTATADLIGGRLVNDPNKGNEFLIAKDHSLADGLLYAVPNAIRFSTKADYQSYYEKYYDCDNPSGGAVWIKSPTTVRLIDGGWQLVEKGELETR